MEKGLQGRINESDNSENITNNNIKEIKNEISDEYSYTAYYFFGYLILKNDIMNYDSRY